MDIHRWLTATALATEPRTQQFEPRPPSPKSSIPAETRHRKTRDKHQERQEHQRRLVVPPNAGSELRPAHEPENSGPSPTVKRPPKRPLSEVEQVHKLPLPDDGTKHAPAPYTRRKRHKTREDRYDSTKQKTTVKAQRKKKQAREDKPKTRKHKKPTAGDIMGKFHADNVTKERLTLKTNVGILSRGRASKPLPSRGVPDLTFSEMRFLKKVEPYSAAHSQHPAGREANDGHMQNDPTARQSHHFQHPREATPIASDHVPLSSKAVAQLRSPRVDIPDSTFPRLPEHPQPAEHRSAEGPPPPAATSYLSWSSSKGDGKGHTFTKSPILAPSQSSSLLDMERIRAPVLDYYQPPDLPQPPERSAKRQHEQSSAVQYDYIEPRQAFVRPSIGSGPPLAVVPQPQGRETRLKDPSDRSGYRLLSDLNSNASSRHQARGVKNRTLMHRSQIGPLPASPLLRPVPPHTMTPSNRLHGAWEWPQCLTQMSSSENRAVEPDSWYHGLSDHDFRSAHVDSRPERDGVRQVLTNDHSLQYDQLYELGASQIAPGGDINYSLTSAQLGEAAMYGHQRPGHHDPPTRDDNEWPDLELGHVWRADSAGRETQIVMTDQQNQSPPRIANGELADQRPSYIPQNFWATGRLY